MKLVSIKNGRDGALALASPELTRATSAAAVAPTMQAALDDWAAVAPSLRALSAQLEKGEVESFALCPDTLAAPLPRAFQWADGSAYVNHVELVRRARGAVMPASFWHEPLMYQGGSDYMLGAREPIIAADEDWGVDFEGEIAVIIGDVPAGCERQEAEAAILLLVLVNDVSLRNLIPAELEKGFGFFQSKPPTAFSPAAVTPDELGDAWRHCKVHLPLAVSLNGASFGRTNAGEDMVFDFADLIVHAAKTRPLRAGTIVGSGTVSNKNPAVGSSCIAERRMLEIIADGRPQTPFLQDGDLVQMDMRQTDGQSIFGAIEQRVIIGQSSLTTK